MKNFFLVPGRLISKILGGDKKRTLRSPRHRSEASAGQVLVSIIFWVGLVASIVFVVDAVQHKVVTPSLPGANLEAVTKSVTVLESPPKTPLQESASIGTLNAPVASPEPSPEELVAVEQWLVILHTIPKIPKSGRNEAERRQARYQARGLVVDILDTDAFSRLKSGSWIIALGPFEDRAIAQRMAEEARRFNSGLIVRRGL